MCSIKCEKQNDNRYHLSTMDGQQQALSLASYTHAKRLGRKHGEISKTVSKVRMKKYKCTILYESSEFTVKDFCIKVIFMPVSMTERVILRFAAAREKEITKCRDF